ncbi:MAG: hypothetical protein ABI333_04965 [bacterium]
MESQKAKYPYTTEIGIYKKQINDVVDASKNHPIHDAVEKISYAGGRYDIIVVLDGVSESKSSKKLVPIGRMLSWDLARFCQDTVPEDINALIEWFKSTTENPKYKGKGNTTVALLRLDRSTGHVDGFTAGDSVALLAVDRLRPNDGGEQELRCFAEVVASLHCVANYPGVIYNGWRHGVAFEPESFSFQLPNDWENAYLVAMSDGYGKISDAVSSEIYDYNEADQILAQRFPDFARVYLPQSLVEQAEGVRRSPSGRVLRSAIIHREELWEAISAYYDEHATETERRELELIDLDCRSLADLIKKPSTDVKINGKTAEEVFAASHRSLRWMTQARYMDAEDEVGLEEYLRQYVMAELFAEAMISEMYEAEGGDKPLHLRLHAFGEYLGDVGDDFGVALMKIRRSER